MKIAVIIARVSLALPFLIFGLNGLSLFACSVSSVPLCFETVALRGVEGTI